MLIAQRLPLPTGATTSRCPLAGMVDQQTLHDTGADRKEVGPALPARLTLAAELEECLVDQRCRLQSVAGILTAHVVLGQVTKLLVCILKQLLRRCSAQCVTLTRPRSI
jgi:hypothetical protein